MFSVKNWQHVSMCVNICWYIVYIWYIWYCTYLMYTRSSLQMQSHQTDICFAKVLLQSSHRRHPSPSHHLIQQHHLQMGKARWAHQRLGIMLTHLRWAMGNSRMYRGRGRTYFKGNSECRLDLQGVAWRILQTACRIGVVLEIISGETWIECVCVFRFVF